MMADKFAKERFCDKCEKTVPVEFRDKTVEITVYGQKVPITYKASYCSVCGQAVCERDFDDALQKYLDDHADIFPKERPE